MLPPPGAPEAPEGPPPPSPVGSLVGSSLLHAESVTSTGGHVSWFPFGAQCTYATSQATEVAVSVVPLWPSIAIVLGAALTTLAVAGAFRAWRVPR